MGSWPTLPLFFLAIFFHINIILVSNNHKSTISFSILIYLPIYFILLSSYFYDLVYYYTWYKKWTWEIKIFLMDFCSLFFSCLMLDKAHWILFWPPDICNIKVISKVHNVYFSCQSKQSPDVYFSCVTLKNLIIKCGT
jgi:hypothetical protein